MATKTATKPAQKPVAKKAAPAAKQAEKPTTIEAALKAQGPFIAPKPEGKAGKVVVKAGEKKPAVKKAETDQPSKADLARAIYKRLANKPRKEVIAAFIAEAGLTPAGAATYLANIKRQAAETK